MLQVVETNLVAFDCHWILINEVSVMEMIYGSCTGCAFSSPYCPGNMDGFRSRTLLGVWRREESIKSFWLLLFHIISSNNTQNLMTKDILFHWALAAVHHKQKQSSKDFICFILTSYKGWSHCIQTKVSEMTKVTLEEFFWMSIYSLAGSKSVSALKY